MESRDEMTLQGSGHGSNLHSHGEGSSTAQAGALHAPPLLEPLPNPVVVLKKKKRGRPRKNPLPDCPNNNITEMEKPRRGRPPGKKKLAPSHEIWEENVERLSSSPENCGERKRKARHYPGLETGPSSRPFAPVPSPQAHGPDSHSGSSGAPLIIRRHRSSSAEKIKKKRQPIRAARREETWLRYRSNLVSSIRFLSYITLRQRQVDSISKTPFGEFLMPFLEKKVSPWFVQKSDNEIHKVLLTYNSSKRRFIIAQKELTITPVECQLIFGIKSGTKEMYIVRDKVGRKPTTGFVARRFPEIKELTVKMLRDLLIELKDSDDETAIDDVTRIIVLHLMVTFFFTTTSGNIVPWTFMEFVEDLDKINDYNWATEITSFFLESVHKSRPECVPGCTLLLMYWLCERTTLIEPTMEHTFPRFRKWILPYITEKLSLISMEDIQPHQVHENPVKPLLKELQNLGMIHEIEDIKSEKSDSESYESLPEHRNPELDKNSQVHEIGDESSGEGDELDASSQGIPPQLGIENHAATADLIEDIGSLELNITDLVMDAIKAKHGDIDKDCIFKSEWVRKQNLIVICNVLKELEKKSLDELDIASLENYYEGVRDIEKMNINVEWLLQRLDEIKDAITSRDEMKYFNDEKKELMKKMEEKRKEVEEKRREVEEKQREVEEKRREVEEKQREVEEKQREEEELNTEIQISEGQLELLNNTISNQTSMFGKFQNKRLMDGLI